jgi:hypothetical protein
VIVSRELGMATAATQTGPLNLPPPWLVVVLWTDYEHLLSIEETNS